MDYDIKCLIFQVDSKVSSKFAYELGKNALNENNRILR